MAPRPTISTGDVTPSVMSSQSETPVTEHIHDRYEVARCRPLGMRGVIHGRRRPARSAVPAKVRADDCEAALDELRSDSMPRGRGPRVPMEQDHWRTIATVTHKDRCFPDVDLLRLEALEHGSQSASILQARRGSTTQAT